MAVADPIQHVCESEGLTRHKQPQGTSVSFEEAGKLNRQLSQVRSQEIKRAVPKGENRWSRYPEEMLSPSRKAS